MEPSLTYKIWFTQRSGSTLLCKGLEQTGLAGVPGEYFYFSDEGLFGKYGVRTYQEFRDKVWDLGTTPNGVFGMKLSVHASWDKKWVNEVKKLEGFNGQDIDNPDRLSDFFPGCKHIFLTRRNKIRQAVSWWKAIKDEVWHLEADKVHEDKSEFYEKHYDFAAITHLMKELVLKECALEEYFTGKKIQPLTIVYEDYLCDYRGTIRQILDYLGIEHEGIKTEGMFYKKTANENSEKWVQRFREDLQKEMGHVIW